MTKMMWNQGSQPELNISRRKGLTMTKKAAGLSSKMRSETISIWGQ